MCRGTRLPERQETGPLSQQGKIEIFDAGQYVILTSEVFKSHRTIPPHQDTEEIFRDIQQRYLPERSEPVDANDMDQSFDPTKISSNLTGVSAQDIYRTINEYAKTGSPPAKRARDRWQSPAGTPCGFQSASEADLSLCSDLAFWCRGDADLVKKCFEQSNRIRNKWDEVHYPDGRTYGDGTVQTAVQSTYDIFSGDYVTR